MSATGRNLPGSERHAGDFYETPAWCTRAILPHLVPGDPSVGVFAWGGSHTPRAVLDAGSGTGAITRVVGKFFPEAIVAGIELDEDRVRRANEWEPYPDREDLYYGCGSFFDECGPGKWDLVISNPPYVDAEGFVTHALRIAEVSCFLLRLNWLASKKRAAFHREHPADVFVLPKRPSFTGGGTDATEYAWFVWGEGRGNRWFLLNVE